MSSQPWISGFWSLLLWQQTRYLFHHSFLSPPIQIFHASSSTCELAIAFHLSILFNPECNKDLWELFLQPNIILEVLITLKIQHLLCHTLLAPHVGPTPTRQLIRFSMSYYLTKDRKSPILLKTYPSPISMQRTVLA
jgi:hypothetical protein